MTGDTVQKPWCQVHGRHYTRNEIKMGLYIYFYARCTVYTVSRHPLGASCIMAVVCRFMKHKQGRDVVDCLFSHPEYQRRPKETRVLSASLRANGPPGDYTLDYDR